MTYINYIGFISIILSITISIVYWFSIIRPLKNTLVTKHYFVIIYIQFCVWVYLTSKNIYAIIDTNSFGPLLSSNYQITLIILSINLLLQITLTFKMGTLFYRMVIPSIINAIMLFSTLYFVGWGIINTVWYIVFTGSIGGYIFLVSIFDSFEMILKSMENVDDDIEKGKILEIIRDESNKYLKMGLQTFLALGASIGVSMSILFKNGKADWENLDYLTSASLIIINFGLVSLGLLFWLLKPYIDTFAQMRLHFQKYINKNHILLIKSKQL